MQIHGTPLLPPSWPQSRGVPRIFLLHKGPNDWGGAADLSQIIENLPRNAIAADIGTGSGQMPLHVGGLRPDLHWNLVSATSLNPSIAEQLLERGSNLYYCLVPEDLKILEDNYSKCHLIMDTYGAVTYDNNPDLVLLLYALLLAPGGTASMVVSTTNDQTPTHVFTHDETLQQINDFLKEKVGVSLKWASKHIASQAKPGTYCTDFVFRMVADATKEQKAINPKELFAELSQQLRETIGTPHITEAPWYSSSDFHIVAKQYYK